MSDGGAIHGHRAVRVLVIHEAPHQALDVSVEYDSNEVTVTVDNRGAGIPPNNIGGAYEIERCREIEALSSLLISLWQIKRCLIVEAVCTVVQPVKCRPRRRHCPVHRIPLHRPV